MMADFISFASSRAFRSMISQAVLDQEIITHVAIDQVAWDDVSTALNAGRMRQESWRKPVTSQWLEEGIDGALNLHMTSIFTAHTGGGFWNAVALFAGPNQERVIEECEDLGTWGSDATLSLSTWPSAVVSESAAFKIQSITNGIWALKHDTLGLTDWSGFEEVSMWLNFSPEGSFTPDYIDFQLGKNANNYYSWHIDWDPNWPSHEWSIVQFRFSEASLTGSVSDSDTLNHFRLRVDMNTIFVADLYIDRISLRSHDGVMLAYGILPSVVSKGYKEVRTLHAVVAVDAMIQDE